MSITAFWSPLHGSGATSCLIATAFCMAEGHDKPVIITETHFALNNLEGPLLKKGKNVDEKTVRAGKGIDTLTRYASSGGINPDIVKNVSYDITDKIMFMPGTATNEYELHSSETTRGTIKHTLYKVGNIMEKYNVLIDTNAGENDSLSTDALDIADNVVVCLRQNKALIEKALSNQTLIDLSQKKGMYFCFSEYDDMSKLNLYNIQKNYKILRGAVGGIPYNTGYSDSISDCDVKNFLRRTIALYEPKEARPDDWWKFVDEFTKKIL